MTDGLYSLTDTYFQRCRYCDAPFTHPWRGCCTVCLTIGYAHMRAIITLPPGKRPRP